MKHYLIFIFLLFITQAKAADLMVGDLLLQPLDCWSCRLIEEQEETPYSHIAIVVQTKPEILVAEALGTVRTLSLTEWNQRTQKNQKVGIYRFQHEGIIEYLQTHKKSFLDYYKNTFDGILYDKDFLWNNFDESGREKMYCSEFVSKFLQGFLGIELPIKRMKFDKNREDWLVYFKGNPPDGMWGNSPGDFEKSDKFFKAGEL